MSGALFMRLLRRLTVTNPIFLSAKIGLGRRFAIRRDQVVNELYASVYARSYGFRATGLRYFNVFGPRQDPEILAAVIPRWTAAMVRNQRVTINGDGETSRDFCFVANAVQANIRAPLSPDETQGVVYNIAVGERTSLNRLFEMLRETLALHQDKYDHLPDYGDFKPGDVRHSEADISKAQRLISFAPTPCIGAGLTAAVPIASATTVAKRQ